ncbi:MAG: hypothetical protein D6705_18315 [Deltaproteobacteria bacterium]|nr:MAG: hypothetical protein D6705_18315 [Deltaproteobacteria bacterium]
MPGPVEPLEAESVIEPVEDPAVSVAVAGPAEVAVVVALALPVKLVLVLSAPSEHAPTASSTASAGRFKKRVPLRMCPPW